MRCLNRHVNVMSPQVPQHLKMSPAICWQFCSGITMFKLGKLNLWCEQCKPLSLRSSHINITESWAGQHLALYQDYDTSDTLKQKHCPCDPCIITEIVESCLQHPIHYQALPASWIIFPAQWQPTTSGTILCMRQVNEWRRYNVTSSLIGWAHTQNDPCNIFIHVCQNNVAATLQIQFPM